MTKERLRLLIVLENDADGAFVERTISTLNLQDCELSLVSTFQSGVEHLMSHKWDVVVIDLFLSDGPAPNELFLIVRKKAEEALIIALSPSQDERTAQHVLNEGAHAVLMRERVDRFALLTSIQSALRIIRLKETIKQQHDETRRLLEQMTVGLLVINQQQGVVFSNPAANQILGNPAGVPIGHTFEIPREQGSHPEVSMPLTDGSEVSLDIEVITSTWNDQNCRIALLHKPAAIASSETDQPLLNRRLDSRQRAETLGLLAGGIAHDFNNMLAGILGHAEVLSLEIGGDDPASKSVAMIKQASMKAAALCQQLKGYAGEQISTPVTCDLSEIVREHEPLLRTSESSAISLEFGLAETLPNVKVDPSQVLQVILNLVINSKEALGQNDGTIRIETREFTENTSDFGDIILQPAEPPTQHVAIQVHDKGCGMSSETASQSLEPFFSTKQEKGGLGLSIVRNIMKEYGGLIAVKSAPNQGTTFSVAFPSAEYQAPTIEEPFASFDSDWRYTGNVLVVDDEHQVREVTGRLLGHFGCRVTKAASGAEALAHLDDPQQSFDIVLLDLSMPGQSGPATLQAIRALNDSIAVILMSGFGEEHSSQQIGDARIDAFLRKPFGVEALCTKLQAVSSR